MSISIELSKCDLGGIAFDNASGPGAISVERLDFAQLPPVIPHPSPIELAGDGHTLAVGQLDRRPGQQTGINPPEVRLDFSVPELALGLVFGAQRQLDMDRRRRDRLPDNLGPNWNQQGLPPHAIEHRVGDSAVELDVCRPFAAGWPCHPDNAHV